MRYAYELRGWLRAQHSMGERSGAVSCDGSPWEREFAELSRLLSRLKPREEW
jgi:hypothetical protein